MNMQHCETRPHTRIDVAGTGFTVLDRIFEDGILGDESLGGSCGNVLVSLAMLQRCVAPVLALGDDQVGERLVNEFAQAGAITDYINRRTNLRSPMLNQILDTLLGEHDFNSICHETNSEHPGYETIDQLELKTAAPAIAQCRIFYADRISDSVLEAMKKARHSGAIVYFEPSAIEENDLFDRALELTSILKYSSDRLGDRLSTSRFDCIHIVTHGAAGLEVRDRQWTRWCASTRAELVKDTCGSGDMVSVGLIDWLLTHHQSSSELSGSELVDGVVAGQRLAAKNCAYAGARGLFKEHGAEFARQILA
ncbi:PfkB family carbohydrate kinase [uncultured Tateyamaria sp.]|uniref:PfkB family carbohydrate kinase n=1 Tax=uncultured Tateyamaria sp. TaxID=455651 RepID=UPI002606D4BA|nr:PfkB family carbohydrate kinase [uncultured Tateyamaria sp.]